MLEFLEKYSGNIWTSQNGEESLLLEIARRLEIVEGSAVEAGAADGLMCSNTALLIRDYGWSGLMVEADHDLYLKCRENWKDNQRVRCVHCAVDESNINSLVDESCDLLSLDTDGPDYLIFRALQARPKIVIIEVDSCIPPDRYEFNSAGGAGYLPMLKLAIQKSYFLICHTGNLLLCDNKYRDLFPEIVGDGISNADLYFNNSWIEGGWYGR